MILIARLIHGKVTWKCYRHIMCILCVRECLAVNEISMEPNRKASFT